MKWHDAGESKEVKYSSLQHEYHTPWPGICDRSTVQCNVAMAINFPFSSNRLLLSWIRTGMDLLTKLT